MTKNISCLGDGNQNNIISSWSSMSSTVELKRSRIEESLNIYFTSKSRLLLKILVICISIALIGFIVTSLLSPRHSHQQLINNGNINKSIQIDSSTIKYTRMTAAENNISASTASSSSTTYSLPTLQTRHNLRFNSQPSSPSNNIITSQKVHQQQQQNQSENSLLTNPNNVSR